MKKKNELSWAECEALIRGVEKLEEANYLTESHKRKLTKKLRRIQKGYIEAYAKKVEEKKRCRKT